MIDLVRIGESVVNRDDRLGLHRTARGHFSGARRSGSKGTLSRNYSGVDPLHSERGAMDASVDELANGVIELDGDAVRASLDHRGRQAVDVGGLTSSPMRTRSPMLRRARALARRADSMACRRSPMVCCRGMTLRCGIGPVMGMVGGAAVRRARPSQVVVVADEQPAAGSNGWRPPTLYPES